jgi:hypothetical protein
MLGLQQYKINKKNIKRGTHRTQPIKRKRSEWEGRLGYSVMRGWKEKESP